MLPSRRWFFGWFFATQPQNLVRNMYQWFSARNILDHFFPTILTAKLVNQKSPQLLHIVCSLPFNSCTRLCNLRPWKQSVQASSCRIDKIQACAEKAPCIPVLHSQPRNFRLRSHSRLYFSFHSWCRLELATVLCCWL